MLHTFGKTAKVYIAAVKAFQCFLFRKKSTTSSVEKAFTRIPYMVFYKMFLSNNITIYLNNVFTITPSYASIENGRLTKTLVRVPHMEDRTAQLVTIFIDKLACRLA